MRNMTLLMLALAALLGAAHGQVKDAPAAAGPLWDGPCPATWPAGLKGTGVALTLKFAADSDADCAAPGFASAAASVSSKSAAALTAVGALAAVETRVLDPSGIKFLPTNVAGCKSQGGVGVAQTIVDATKTWLEFPDARWQRQLAADLHLADACPSNPASYERKSLGKVWTAFCSEMAAGRRLASATACVQNAPSDITYVPGRAAAACFPGDAALMRADSATGAALGPARMDELAIGDAVQCLVPSGVPGGRRETGLYRDDQQAYAPGVCHVFGYLDADKDRRVSFVALHYTDAAGRPAKLRASPEHLVYVAAASMAAASASAAAAAPLKELPPGGAARRADAVSVGDLLAVQSEGGAYRLAAVKEITREVHQGAYAPLLTNAGLPLVDGAAAFSWVHLLPDSAPHPMQNIGEYMRHIRLVMDFKASLESGCAGAACACLDAPQDPSRPCLRVGDRLSNLPPGKSDFAQRSLDTLVKALRDGRTVPDYASGIRTGRLYQANRWLWWAGRALGLKPHTIGVFLTDYYLTAPPADAAAAPGLGSRAAGPAGRLAQE